MELTIALLFSVNLFGAFFIHKLYGEKKALAEKLEKALIKPLTTDASQLLAELIKGQAVIVTNVIDPNAVFLWGRK